MELALVVAKEHEAHGHLGRVTPRTDKNIICLSVCLSTGEMISFNPSQVNIYDPESLSLARDYVIEGGSLREFKDEITRLNRTTHLEITPLDMGHYEMTNCGNCGQNLKDEYIQCSSCKYFFQGSKIDHGFGGSDFD